MRKSWLCEIFCFWHYHGYWWHHFWTTLNIHIIKHFRFAEEWHIVLSQTQDNIGVFSPQHIWNNENMCSSRKYRLCENLCTKHIESCPQITIHCLVIGNLKNEKFHIAITSVSDIESCPQIAIHCLVIGSLKNEIIHIATTFLFRVRFRSNFADMFYSILALIEKYLT